MLLPKNHWSSLNRWVVVFAIVGAISILASHAEHHRALSDEAIWTIENAPVSAKQEKLIAELFTIIYDGVALKSERKSAGGAFGIHFGQIFSDHDDGADIMLAAPKPHRLLTEYTVKITPTTHQAYRIYGRAFFADQSACLSVYEQITTELNDTYPRSLELYNDPSGDFLLHTADAAIEVSCGHWHGQQALSVSYTAEQWQPLVRIENQASQGQRNKHLKPLGERRSLAPFLGVRWDMPFDAEQHYPDNMVVFHPIIPPEPDPRFSRYEMRRDNFSSQPMHIVAEQMMTDLDSCMSQVKSIEEGWQQQYSSSAWYRELSTEHYGVRITARDGGLASACREVGQGQYRLSMVGYQHADETEHGLGRRLAYDAARLLSDQPPIFFSEIASQHSAYTRVRQIVEQYRQLQSGN